MKGNQYYFDIAGSLQREILVQSKVAILHI